MWPTQSNLSKIHSQPHFGTKTLLLLWLWVSHTPSEFWNHDLTLIHSYARRKYIWARGNWYIWYPYTTLVLKIFGMNCLHTTNLSPFYHICNQGISMHLSITLRNLTKSHFQLWSRKGIKVLNKCALLVWGSTRFLASPTLKCESISSSFSLKFPLYCKIRTSVWYPSESSQIHMGIILC